MANYQVGDRISFEFVGEVASGLKKFNEGTIVKVVEDTSAREHIHHLVYLVAVGNGIKLKIYPEEIKGVVDGQ